MDHQVHLDSDRFATVVDTIGGVQLQTKRLSGAEVVAYLAADPALRSERTAQLLKAALKQASMGSAFSDPGRFDAVMSALTPCLTVDAGLTSDVIRETMMESRVQAEEILTWQLPTWTSTEGLVADSTGLTDLRAALSGDSFPQAKAANQPR
jgi:hypothetical protein